MPQCASFNQSSHEADDLKVASKIKTVDSMLFDDHHKLYLSFTPRNSQDYWSCDSESTDDSNLENWAENSGLLDETFLSLLSSISRVQPPLDLNSSHLHHDLPDSILRVNVTKLQGDKDAIPSASTNAWCTSCESNLTVLVGIKGRSQVKCPLICEIDTNYQGN